MVTKQYIERFNKAYCKVKNRSTVWEEVTRLNMAVTNKCNANCVFCYREEFNKHVEPTVIPHTTACNWMKSVIKEYPIKRVNFGMTSEPTMHPDLPLIVDYATNLGLETRVSTNLQLLTPSLSKRLLEAGLKRVCFSIDEYQKKPFRNLRVGLSWEKVLWHAYQFKKVRDEHGYKCRIYVNPVLCKETKGRENEITHFWGNISDIKPVMCREIPTGLHPRVEPWFDITEKPICTDTFAIYTNGKVAPCCFDTFNMFPLGDMNINTPRQIVEGKAVETLRRRHETLERVPYHCLICVSLPRMAGRKMP